MTTRIPEPTEQQPVTVGPYNGEGRIVRVRYPDGRLTVPGPFTSAASFARYVDNVRPHTDLSPAAGQIQWADRPDEWPED
jgi:hypothetical protein